MSKIRKISSAKIRKIQGGKDPTKLVEDFLVRRGFDPEECLQQRTSDIATWSVSLSEESELELTLEGVPRPLETTLYMGLNVCGVPLKDTTNFLQAALLVADTLIGAKLSVVNYDLVPSNHRCYTENMGSDMMDYYYELITRQKSMSLRRHHGRDGVRLLPVGVSVRNYRLNSDALRPVGKWRSDSADSWLRMLDRNHRRSDFRTLLSNAKGHRHRSSGPWSDGGPAAGLGLAGFCELSRQICRLAGLDRMDLLGHSVGGRFAASLAAIYPNRVNRLILADASGIKPPRPLKYYFKVALAKTGKYSERFHGPLGAKPKKRIYAQIASADYRNAGEMRNSFIKIVNEDIREILPKIKAKTLLLWGEDDLDTPLSSR